MSGFNFVYETPNVATLVTGGTFVDDTSYIISNNIDRNLILYESATQPTATQQGALAVKPFTNMGFTKTAGQNLYVRSTAKGQVGVALAA